MRIISSKDFRKEELKKLLKRGKTDLSEIVKAIRIIIDDVKKEGDKAFLNYTDQKNLSFLVNCFDRNSGWSSI